MRRLFAFALSVTPTACSTLPNPPPPPASAPSSVEVQILAINDFHGNLEPPGVTIDATLPDGGIAKVAAGGIAYLAGAAKALRAGQRHSVTVSAGDMIGASPLVSALFLDEPTIAGMNLIGVDYNAVGNHEFD
ncbi:MAG: bifunctional metallophosphatase/5'-nucleotidase, partial [Sphingomonas bacterium]|nr:bifunctional metallophosphatase/5'-nucleotidase [Sphingomonas bacterium]